MQGELSEERINAWVTSAPGLFADTPRAQYKYLCYQIEAGDDEGRPHAQGMVLLQNSKTFAATVALLGGRGIHIEPMRGTADEARAYCMKLEGRLAGPFETGDYEEARPARGRRSDIHAVAQAVKDGETLRKIAQDFPAQVIRYHKGIFQLRAWLAAPDTSFHEDRKVWYLHGKSGVGKTRLALKLSENRKMSRLSDGTWFSDIDAPEVILLDDLAPAQVPLHWLLAMLDKQPGMTLSVKHLSAIPMTAVTAIIITSNFKPEELYPNASSERKAALLRRIDFTLDGPAVRTKLIELLPPGSVE